jgi:hypothetical protein
LGHTESYGDSILDALPAPYEPPPPSVERPHSQDSAPAVVSELSSTMNEASNSNSAQMASQSPMPISSQEPVVQEASGIALTINPNPFSNQTIIALNAPKDISLNLTVYDILGNIVTPLFNGKGAGDRLSFMLDGNKLAPGTYLVRVQSGNNILTKQLKLVR